LKYICDPPGWKAGAFRFGSSKARDQSAIMQPRRANVGAAVVAHCAEHTRL
jgi:hypothetical protein